MMRRRFLRFAAAFAALIASTGVLHAQNAVKPDDWSLYKARFLDPSGRIVDDANGRISHSEGQGYGLLLAFFAGARADFDLIWSFTRTELLLRDDGLVAWKWDPKADPHVSDPNNATDGDILVAYALALAGEGWERPDLTAQAAAIAAAVGAETVREEGGRLIFLPAAQGFSRGERADGPVVNPSYWVFEAFPVLARLAPGTDWNRLRADGLALLAAARFGKAGMPTDWISLAAAPKPAEGFPAEFGYNNLRIPLYLLRAGVSDRALLDRLRTGMRDGDGARTVGMGGETRDRLADPGYRAIPALVDCVLDGERLPADLRRFSPTVYYPSTLHLLALAYAQRSRKECL